ncbi:transposase ImeAB' protein, partial [Candidatus Magnetobacterium bavaricum]
MTCIQCGSEEVVKNGSIHDGKQKFMCKECGRQFVGNPQNIIISQETRDLIDLLLLERMALAAIARVTGVSERWLQDYVNQKYDTVPQYIDVKKKEKGRLTIQCDEMWSFVGNKENKQWIWLALDDDSREVVGAFVGNRDMEGAKGLWDSLPPVYRQCAICYTDFWTAYA